MELVQGCGELAPAVATQERVVGLRMLRYFHAAMVCARRSEVAVPRDVASVLDGVSLSCVVSAVPVACYVSCVCAAPPAIATWVAEQATSEDSHLTCNNPDKHPENDLAKTT